MILDHYPSVKDNLLEIKTSGLEAWSQKQQKRVDEGLRYSDLPAETKTNQNKV